MRAVVRILLAGALTLGGCATPEQTDPVPASASQFGENDKAWIATTAAMDEQVVPLLQLVPQNSGSPAVQALALQVKAFTDAELITLYHLYDQAGLPGVNPRRGTAMPGAVTPAQVAEIAKMTGPPFDAAVVKAVKAHLQQTEDLAKGEDRDGVEPQTRTLALQVLRTRQAALTAAEAIKD